MIKVDRQTAYFLGEFRSAIEGPIRHDDRLDAT